MSAACSIVGCGREMHARGWCKFHHQRWRRNGDPLVTRKGVAGDGYVRKSDGYRFVRGRYEHVAIAERALGKPLPSGAEVHHVDENGSNNVPSNLVICPSKAYHKLLHLRTAALNACGNPAFRKCRICKVWDDPAAMASTRDVEGWWHRACARAYQRRMNFPSQRRRA